VQAGEDVEDGDGEGDLDGGEEGEKVLDGVGGDVCV
jgi:hypothetical protein